MLTTTVAASADDPATASIVRPANDAGAPGAPLSSGDAQTPFSLKLPASAACTGDSATAGYRVQSFMVPITVDPASLTYDIAGPIPNATGAAFRQPLYAANGDPFVDGQTAKGQKNDPGYVVNVPAFSLAVYHEGDVPAGAYRVGLACTKGTAGPQQLDRLWVTTMTVAADRSWTTASTDTPAASGVAAEVSASTSSLPRDNNVAHAAASETEASRARVERNALPETPGGAPTLNVPVMEVPARVLGIGSVLTKVLALFAVLAALRIAFLFRPRQSMETS